MSDRERWVCPDCAEMDGHPLPFKYEVLAANSSYLAVLLDVHGDPSDTWHDGTRGVPDSLKQEIRESDELPLCFSCGQEAVREGSTVDLGYGRTGTVEERRGALGRANLQ